MIKQLSEQLMTKVSKLEETSGLYMTTYDKQVEESNLTLEQIQYGGYIFEKNTNKVVCANIPRIQTINCFDDIPGGLSDVEMEYCEDGTIVRLYNFNGTWFTATNRCLNAKESYWTANKSFNEMFFEVFDESLVCHLDTSFTYVFVLLHKDNRIVIKHATNHLVYLGRLLNTFDEQCLERESIERDILGIKGPEVIVPNVGMTVEELYKSSKRGIIIRKQMKSYKIDFQKYKEYKYVRGNCARIDLRVIELIQESSYMLDMFKNVFPEHSMEAERILSKLDELVMTIYRLYVDSHIKHLVSVNEESKYYRTLKQLHAQYKTTGVAISYDAVKQKVYSLSKFVIYNMIK